MYHTTAVALEFVGNDSTGGGHKFALYLRDTSTACTEENHPKRGGNPRDGRGQPSKGGRLLLSEDYSEDYCEDDFLIIP